MNEQGENGKYAKEVRARAKARETVRINEESSATLGLCLLLIIIGFLTLAATGFSAYVHFTKYIGIERAAEGIAICISGILAAVLIFGAASALTLLARMAYYLQQIKRCQEKHEQG